MTELDGKSLNVVEEDIERLKQIFPEVFAEGKIDFDKLQELLGNYVNENEDNYSFTWHGKRQAIRTGQAQSTGTLRPVKEESTDWDTTGNLFIEGDNLEVLKLLQKSYQRKIKMIYIDPPYNTGNEFIYPDDYKDNLDTYLRYTGQLDENGRKVSTDSNKSGRYHTNWLNMMYPRLKLARNLLREDGVIFISIDDHEQANLKKLCDQIFGEENFICDFIRKTRSTTDFNKKRLNKQHENCLAYAKGMEQFTFKGEKKDFSNFKNPDNDPNGPWVATNPSISAGTRKFAVINPSTGKEYYPPRGRGWSFKKEELEEYIENGKIKFKDESRRGFMLKLYLSEVVRDTKVVDSLFATDNCYMNQVGTKERNELFEQKVMDYPKPSRLIKKLIQCTTEEGDIILDFFAGSCTTADAVMQMNVADDGKRQYICVQLPEHCKEDSEAFQAGYATIAEIGKERIRRSAKKIKGENSDYAGDLGFKAFKLDSSNLKRWEASFETLKNDLKNALDHIKWDRSGEDILYEILIKYGYPLTAPIEKLEIDKKTVYSIDHGSLICCFDKELSLDLAEGIGQFKESRELEFVDVVFRDDGFKDNVTKTNIMHVLSRFGIADANLKSL